MSASWYNRHVLPHLLDFLCSLQPVRRQREKIVPRAEGRVLEVGIGTGLNVRHYDKTKVGKITGLDPALEMHRLASKRIAQAGLDVDLVGLSAEEIPLDDASFDCVVVTYTLCSVPDPVTELKEMRRVLKTGGGLVLRARPRAGRKRAALARSADPVLEKHRRRVSPQS